MPNISVIAVFTHASNILVIFELCRLAAFGQ